MTMLVRRRLLLLAMLAAAAGAARADGPPVVLRLPIELGQGPLFAQGADDVRDGFNVSLLPGLGYGILDVNAVLVNVMYRNAVPASFVDSVDFGTGVRASVAFWSPAEGVLALR